MLIREKKMNVKKFLNKLKKKQGVPEGADPKVHERCVMKLKQQGKDKSSAYAICNAAGAGKSMTCKACGNMHKSEIVEHLVNLVKSGEMKLEDIKKEVISESIAKAMTSESISNSEPTELQKEAEAAEQEQQAKNEETKKTIKLAPGLFKQFTLGSTLQQSTSGNVITNVKKK